MGNVGKGRVKIDGRLADQKGKGNLGK